MPHFAHSRPCTTLTRTGPPAPSDGWPSSNRAYALVRTAALREAYNRLLTPVNGGSASTQSNGAAAPKAHAPRTTSDVLDFGRYAGWSLKDLARQDPDYLRWLSRHSAGIRYRQRIADLLATPRQQTASERTRGR